MTDAEVERLRESLRKNIFTACYAIARLHKTDEILHQISELMLCSKQATQCIENLVAAVTTNLFASLGVLLPTRSSPVADTGVGLHLIALLFTRCRFICAQIVHKYSLISVLTALLTGDVDTLLSHPLPVLLNLGESSTTPSPYVSSQSLVALDGDENLLMLAAIILDQYERTVGAIRLRKKTVELYKDCHSWSWFDERANLWHPQSPDLFQAADVAFHSGATRAQWSVDRNRYAVEFPTMTQINLSSMHRRPVLLMPCSLSPGSSDSPRPTGSTTQMTDYESMIINMEAPVSLSADLRKNLCLALLRRFSRSADKPLSAECLNSFLRLLLRLTASSFEDAKTVANADGLRILFTLSHPFEFFSQYSAFVGHIIRQLFDDPSTVAATLQQILNKFAEGVCSSCRDLFYLLSLCAPLVAKAEELSIRLMKETFSLVIDEKSIEDGVLPKSFSIATPLETSANDATVDLSPELNSHQKQIVVFIIEALVKPLTPTGILNAPAQTHDGWSHVSTVVGGNSTASKVTSDSEAQPQEHNPEELLSLCVGLAKQDYLRYLVDLAITSRRVAEFISKYVFDGVKGTTDRSSFVSYLFATELQEQANMELTVLLLETLAFNTSLSTQSAIISEFKSSLRDIVSEGLAPLNNPDEGHKRNQRIIAHMRFLDQLLFLPPPTSVHIIKQIYKRQIPCDIAKLLALVNCNLTNTQQTLNFLVKVLEVLTESVQHNRPDLSAPGRQQQRRQNYVTVMTTVADDLHSATETANPVMSSLAPSVEGEPMLVDLTPPTSSNSRRTAAPVSTQENSPHQQHPSAEVMEHVDTTESRSPEESSSAADIHAQASDLSFSESVFSRGDIVLHSLTGLQDLSRQGMRQSSDTWALAETASDQDDSEGGNTENGLLILDDDDEDEGSAGQGGETDNSQDGGEEDVEDRQDLSGSTRRRNSDSFDRYSIEDDDDHGDHSDGRSLGVFSRNQLSPILGGVSIENSDLMEGTRRVSADEDDPEDSFREEDDDDDDGEDDDGGDDEDDDDEAEDSDWNVLDQAYEHTANDEEDNAREAVLTVRGLSLPPVDQSNRSENTNLMAALVSDVLNTVDVPPPWSHQLAYAPTQHRSVRRDRDRDGFLLQFSTVGSGGTGGHGLSRHDIGWAVSRPRSFFDFSFGIPAGANGAPLTSNVFPGLVNANFTPSISQATESMMFGSHAATFSGGGALSVAQTNALQNLQPSLPTQHPLLQYPHANYALGDVSLRNGGSSAGGFSNSPALRHQPYMSTPNASNNLSSREGPVISILLPSSRVAVSGSSSTQSASARFGRSNPTAQLPLVLRTSFNRQRLTGGSGASAAAVVATPSAGGSGFNRRPYEVYSSGFHSSQRNRRRGNAPQATSASSPSQPSAQHSQQEADALAWEMLSSFADYQASAISAFTLSASDSASAGGRMDSLSPCLLFSILTNFRRLIDVCRILYGQEVMDMILLSRFEVGLHAIRRRGDEFRQRLAAHQASVVNATSAAEATVETTLGHSSAAAQVPLLTPTTEDQSSRAGPSDDGDTQAANEAEWAAPHVPSNLISSVRPQASMEHQDASRSDQEVAGLLISSEAVPASSPEQTTAAGDAQSRTLTPSTGTASVVTEEIHVPVTDEETIASMVAEGMDPSFLDALPEDVRRELLADHRRTRQLRSQLSSMQLPEHVSAEFLSSLPPSIQEEVLTQVRQETQRQAGSDETQSQSTARAGDAANGPAATPENNAAFLASLPPSVRREVLADMEDFQIDLLPPDLQQEARTLRREHEAQFARAVQGRSLPGLFRPRLDTTYFWQTLSGFGRWDSRAGSYNRFIRNGETLVLGNRGTSAFSGLQSLFSGRNRHLLDHEGLTCILTLLVVSSACPVQRRHTVPALKRVLRNLASQSGIRNWIICTILSLLKRLSEKPLPPDYSVGCSRSSPSTQSALCGPMANSLFAAGFEAALGCWVRIFHPLPALSPQPPPLADESAPGPSTSKPISTDFVYIVHPQAVNLVCSTLLDAIADLARNCPPQFFPLAPHDSQCQEYTSETTQPPDGLQDVPELQTDFWDILARLNKVPPLLCNSEQSQKPAAATSPSTSSALNRSSQRKPRTSGAVSGSSRRSHPPVTRSRNHHQPADAPANANTALPENVSNVKPKRNSPTSADVDTDVCCLDYFSQLANLLRHPVISCRPPLQEKLLSILVGVVREFCKRSRALSQPSTTTEPFINRGDVGPANTIAGETTSGAPPGQYAADPVASSSAVTGDAPERIPKKPVSDLMLCPQPAVIECLCELVVAAKTTEQARSLSVRLVILIAQANATTKAQMLGYLCAAASDLSAIISRQLKVVINEVDNLPPSAKAPLPPNSKTTIPLSASMTRLSSVSDPGVSDAADVNDRSLAPTSVISVASSSTAPPPTVSELELSSLQPLTTSRSEQSRLCCVLHLILHMLSCGSEGISTDDPPTKVTMESIDGLSQLWEDLSHTLDRLETTNDANTVLLLQPLVESLCLAHSTVLRENNTVRRLSRVSTIGAVPSGISFIPNLLPPETDLYEVPPITNASPAFGQSSTNADAEPLSPASIIDLNRPMSPPLINLSNAPDTVSETASSPIARLAETHRTSLNHILRNFSGNLSESSFVAFLSYPRALDFDIKRRFFRQRLQALANRDGSVSRFEDEPVVVSRGRIFEDSYARLHRKSASEWKHKFVIRFQNEEGQDAGGLLREWYLLMSREIFNPNYCLFRVSPADRVTYTINPASFINSNHLSYFKFVGRFIGKAIYDNKLLECYFTRSFYKHMLGVRVRFVDLESEDYDFYKGLEFLLKHDVSELGYDVTFSTEINEFGKNETRDLIEDGRNIIVTEANKNEYVRLVCQERMTGAIRQQLNAFLEGFYEIIPKSLISIFNEQELELLISGLPNIDIEDLKANTTYSKYQPNSPQVRWFWRALESFDQEDRARFLQFITGTSKVPLGGFANLEGMHGPTKFQISRAVVSSINHLPSAHTCFNTLELPPYESYEQLRERLLTAIRECSEGYGMA
ncbi:E3 ubiquitin-protein ligase huwe1 [Sparganum proliferum]